MKLTATILCLFSICLLRAQLHVANNAIFYMDSEVRLELTGSLENNGIFLNNGTIALYGDWLINNVFNGNEGVLELLGLQDQHIGANNISVESLVVNLNGNALFSGNELTLKNRFNLVNGIIVVQEGSHLVLESPVNIIGGSVASYVDGNLTYQGSGFRKFPVGYGGYYAPFSFLNVLGSSPEITLNFSRPNPTSPIPSEIDVLGVSGNGIWKAQLTEGTMESTQVQVDFSGEDLTNFDISNEIRHLFVSPAIVVSDSAGGIYNNLGVLELTNTDSTTYGSVISEIEVALADSLLTAYFAIGLIPRIDPDGVVYIPQIFSPAASKPENQTFRVFGEKISGDNFSMQIFNRYGAQVYATVSFEDANQLGWNGTHQRTGKEEPSGLYFYQITLIRENGKMEKLSGSFYLQR